MYQLGILSPFLFRLTARSLAAAHLLLALLAVGHFHPKHEEIRHNCCELRQLDTLNGGLRISEAKPRHTHDCSLCHLLYSFKTAMLPEATPVLNLSHKALLAPLANRAISLPELHPDSRAPPIA